jgi:hypothetical protein
MGSSKAASLRISLSDSSQAVIQLAPMMPNFVQEHFEKPCPAIRSDLEAMKRSPGLQIDILDDVLRFGAAAREPNRCSKEFVEARQSRRLKVFSLDVMGRRHRRVG